MSKTPVLTCWLELPDWNVVDPWLDYLGLSLVPLLDIYCPSLPLELPSCQL